MVSLFAPPKPCILPITTAMASRYDGSGGSPSPIGPRPSVKSEVRKIIYTLLVITGIFGVLSAVLVAGGTLAYRDSVRVSARAFGVGVIGAVVVMWAVIASIAP